MLMDVLVRCLGYKFNAMPVLPVCKASKCCKVDNNAKVG